MRLVASLLFVTALAVSPANAEDYRPYQTMAEMYRARGELERAEHAQAEAVRLARQQEGEDDVIVVEQLSELGEIQAARGNWGPAAESLGQAIRMSRRLNLLHHKGVGIAGKARAAKVLRLHGHALEQLGKPDLAVLSLKRATELEAEVDKALKASLFKDVDFMTPWKQPHERDPFLSHQVRQDGTSGFAPEP